MPCAKSVGGNSKISYLLPNFMKNEGGDFSKIVANGAIIYLQGSEGMAVKMLGFYKGFIITKRWEGRVYYQQGSQFSFIQMSM